MKIRLIAAAAVVVASTLIGYALTGMLERRVRVLTELLQAVRTLRVQIVVLLELLENALLHAGTALFEHTARQLSPRIDAYEAWRTVISAQSRRGGLADCLGESEIQILDRMFAKLGVSGREVQDEALKACEAALENACEQARQRSAQLTKLYVSMGFLAGLSIVVLML